MKLYRPTIWGLWALEVAAALGVGAAINNGLLFWVGGLVSGFVLMSGIIAGAVGSMVKPVERREPTKTPDPIAQMVAFKADRRRIESKAWDDAYCDALGFNERDSWHRLGAVREARKGQPYWSPKPNDPPIKMKTRRAP